MGTKKSKPERVRVAGIDVSAKELAVAMRMLNGNVKEVTIPNTAAGHARLLKLLKSADTIGRVVLEATGTYHLDLTLFLDADDAVQVMVINPLAARRFAQAGMRRAKTDQVDALSLLEFAERMQFVAWQRPSDSRLQLRAVGRYIDQLSKDRVAIQNRLAAASATGSTPKFVIDAHTAQIADLTEHLTKARKEASRITEADEDLKDAFDVLKTIPGIADRTAIRLMAEFVVLPDDMSPDELVAYAGLDPRPFHSGRRTPTPRISKQGNARIRGALFLPAMSTAKWSPAMRDWHQKLLARGKPKMVALVAVMRRLLRIAWVLFLRRTAWDEQAVRPQATRKQADAPENSAQVA